MPCQPDPPVSQVSGTGRLLEPHRFPNEYAVGNKIESPSHLYVREDLVLDPLDTWLAKAFAPHRIGQSLTALENAQPDHTPAVEAARRAIAECKRKLARHRAALEAGPDPALVVAWRQEVKQQRTVAETRLANLAAGTVRTDG